MNIEKLPLQQRLSHLKDGIPAHNEYIPAVLRSFADQPMEKYFSSFKEKEADAALRTLAGLLHIPEPELKTMSYQATVIKLAQIQDKSAMHEAVSILAAPAESFYAAYLERKKGARQ